ncbi:TPA: fibronectin type III domain-containing protein [Bacillus cereus]|uniref:fibronectin type III domain-containing protein n=3 Tax=Bacillota TaxID=1239 RepID=UPI001241CBA9|nr:MULTISPECIES: fibronectin type III domain-containing protein [Bacilli]MCP1143135.1 fibronectin type III domain-containing protein [Bacillus cereus]
MKIKKCGFLLSLVMLICFALPSFASAEVKEVSILQGKKGYTSLAFDQVFSFKGKQFIANNPMFFNYDIGNNRTPSVYFDLGVEAEVTQFRITPSDGNNVRNYKPEAVFTFFDSNKNKIGSDFLKLSSGVEYKKDINFKKVRYVKFDYTSGYNVSGIENAILGMSLLAKADLTKLEDISNLNAVEDVNDVNFTWNNPTMVGFTGVKIYKEGSLVATVDKNKNSYKVDGLEADKNYTFKFVSDYAEGESVGVQKSVKTKQKPKEPMPLVKPPENVFVTPQNGKMVIAWDNVKSPYLEGYNVYIDGKKINDKPSNSNKMIIKNLENEKSYTVQISAVNKENAEGEKSKGISEKPSSDALEVEYDVKMPFSPLDLLTSSISLLAILGGFVLLSIVIYWFRPLKELIVKAVRREKDKK